MNEAELECQLTLLDQLQSSCIGCGLCLEACTTFLATGWEQESPRGRIRLARDFLNGKIQPDSAALATFDRCLGCHACERVCPTSVEYGKLRRVVQELRSALISSNLNIKRKEYRKWIKGAYRLGSSFWRHYGSRWVPFARPLGFKSYQRSYSKKPAPKAITLIVGCLQDLTGHSMIQAAQDVLTQLGYAVHLSANQPCCGAIFDRLIHSEESIYYAKEKQEGQAYQRKRQKAFFKWLPQQVCFLSSLCQSFFEDSAPHLKGHVVDLYDLILRKQQEAQRKFKLEIPLLAYYQPYCHRRKQAADPVWQLLAQIEGLSVQQVPFSSACCGGYGGESLIHPEHAKQLFQHKRSFLDKNSIVIMTSPDCADQFKQQGYTVMYPIELLAQSLR